MDTRILDNVYDEATADCFQPFTADQIVEIVVIASIGRDFNVASIVEATYRYNEEFKYRLTDAEVRRIGNSIARLYSIQRVYRRLGRILERVKYIKKISYNALDESVMVIDYD